MELDTKTLLVAVEARAATWVEVGDPEDLLTALWPRAIRALIAEEELERHIALCADCDSMNFCDVLKGTEGLDWKATYLREAVLLAVQERLLGPGAPR